MRDDKARLLDIIEAIEKIADRMPETQEHFLREELLQIWAVYHLQVIGEAAAGLSAELRQRHPAVPWVDVVAMGNVLVHQYFGIDLHQIWDTVAIDLPKLRVSIESILKEFGD